MDITGATTCASSGPRPRRYDEWAGAVHKRSIVSGLRPRRGKLGGDAARRRHHDARYNCGRGSESNWLSVRRHSHHETGRTRPERQARCRVGLLARRVAVRLMLSRRCACLPLCRRGPVRTHVHARHPLLHRRERTLGIGQHARRPGRSKNELESERQERERAEMPKADHAQQRMDYSNLCGADSTTMECSLDLRPTPVISDSSAQLGPLLRLSGSASSDAATGAVRKSPNSNIAWTTRSATGILSISTDARP
jgi:hypothetical protein